MVSKGLNPAAPRKLLARLREVMAGQGSAQERLKLVVSIIAADMVAEVCSVYIMRAGEVLELFATRGLREDAVHLTRLRVGEGLVGTIAATARPLNLAEAQAHPQFAYRPETGEEIYHSLMGVPILRGGRVIGVLVVQNRTRRHYTDEEVELLQTVAMVLAELAAGGELVSLSETKPADGIGMFPLRLEGTGLSGNFGMGEAVVHQRGVQITRLVAENPDEEIKRLHEALSEMHGALDDMLRLSESMDAEHRDILETYRMFAEDAGWLNKIREAIQSGLTAEAAVNKINEDTRARMANVSDPYLRERIHDLEDLAYRLMQYLTGTGKADPSKMPEHMVLVARTLGPAELMDYDARRLRAIVLEEGSATSHVAIMARALDVAIVSQVRDATDRIDAGDTLIVDATNSQVFVRPGDDIRAAFKANLRIKQQQQAYFRTLRDLPAQSVDGIDVSLNINAGLLLDMEHLEETGADGVGLYRTEIPFMARSSIPDVDDQVAIYRKIYAQSGGKPIVFRTLDAGGDKVLPYWKDNEEENPAMGWRAVRVTLDRPFLLRQQLRALLIASAGRPLHVMFPMIAEAAEFLQAKAILDIELNRLKSQKIEIASEVYVGAMLEVPSLIFQLPSLLPHLNFLSVGSNDLFQFTFASDRGNPRLSGRYDTLSPAMLNVMRAIVTQCDQHNVSLSLCGEMGGRPLEALALIAIGFRKLSMNASSIGPVKNMIRSLDAAKTAAYLDTQINSSEHSIRGKLRDFARDHGIPV